MELSLPGAKVLWNFRHNFRPGNFRPRERKFQPVSGGLAVIADAWLSDWLAEISADLRETVAEALRAPPIPRKLPQGVVFGAITANNPYYCCGIKY